MQTGTVRKVSRHDIRPVQQLIERCLQLYMTRKEVGQILFDLAQIEPRFTKLVWKTLEEENSEFFHAYYLKLRLKEHIISFNKLLEQHVRLMHLNRGVSSTYDSYGPHIQSIAQKSACYAPGDTGPTLKQNMHHSTEGNPITDGSPSFNAGIRAAIEPPTHPIHVDAPQLAMVSSQSSIMSLMQGSNERRMNMEAGCLGSSADKLGPESNAQGALSATEDIPLITAKTSSQLPNESCLVTDSYGYLPETDTLEPDMLNIFSDTS